jgi:glycosyltransferase
MLNVYIFDNKMTRSSIYGIGTYVNELSKSFRLGNVPNVNVCFIHLNYNTKRFFQEEVDNVSHWYFPVPQNKYKDEEKQNQLYFQSVVFMLKKHIRRTDNLIFHLNYLNCKTFSDELKTSFNCKIVLAVHYLTWCIDILGNASHLKNILCESKKNLDHLGIRVKKSFYEEKESLCSVDKVICLSYFTANILQKKYKVKRENISIIYNGLEEQAKESYTIDIIRQKYQLPKDTNVILFAGRLDPVKGLSYFIRASKIVLEQFPDIHFVIAGSGDYDTYLKECGNQWMNIHFLGLLEKTDLYELYSIADIGVMPSFHEQCSYVAIEMMMHGIPIIASTSTGLSEMIVDGYTGMHVPVQEFEDKVEIDVSLLAENIFFLLKNTANIVSFF